MRRYQYLLGDAKREAARLRAQAALWDPVSCALFDRIGIKRGWRVLEIGPGQGSLHLELRRRAGGPVDAVERSPVFTSQLERITKKDGFGRGQVWQTDLIDAPLPRATYDLIFARWVFLFLPNPDAHIRKLVRALKPGGLLRDSGLPPRHVRAGPAAAGVVRFRPRRPRVLRVAGGRRQHRQPPAGSVPRGGADPRGHRSHHQNRTAGIARLELAHDLLHGRDGSLRGLCAVHSRAGAAPAALLASRVEKPHVAAHRAGPARCGRPQAAMTARQAGPQGLVDSRKDLRVR